MRTEPRTTSRNPAQKKTTIEIKTRVDGEKTYALCRSEQRIAKDQAGERERPFQRASCLGRRGAPRDSADFALEARGSRRHRKLVEPFDIIEGAQPPLRPLHLVVRETEFCGQRLAGDFSRRMRENGRNSVRRPRCGSLTDRNCEGFCLPGNRVGLPVLYGGARRDSNRRPLQCHRRALKIPGPNWLWMQAQATRHPAV